MSWKEYKVGDYEKKFYDIKLQHGAVFYGCWPNAGMFNIEPYGQFSESLVQQVRESKLNELGFPEKTGQKGSSNE